MKTRLAIAINILSAMLLSLIPAYSQAPNSIAGDGFLMSEDAGPYSDGGYCLFIPANSGKSYQVINIYNLPPDTHGTYSYLPTSSSTATLILNDSVDCSETAHASFSSLNSGNFTLTAAVFPGAYINGDFNFASAGAQGSIAGKIIIYIVACGVIQLNGVGVPNLTYSVWANTNLATINWGNIGTTTANGLGTIQFTDPNAGNYSQRFYRFTWP